MLSVCCQACFSIFCVRVCLLDRVAFVSFEANLGVTFI